ncbi:hypothetical protein V5O48_017385 [Marasmius crinis-equi]|uniref:Uncharacterized protein n=1 Tax=Marasmius crinis-equi TaxID=585013 RepID=A0ABR3EP28_9AGAR
MFVLLDAITPIIAITFITLTIRMKLRQFSDEREDEAQIRRMSVQPLPRRPTIGSVRRPMHIETDLPPRDRWDEPVPTTPSTIVAPDTESGSQHSRGPSRSEFGMRMKDPSQGSYAYKRRASSVVEL